jgi:hypothetical protein
MEGGPPATLPRRLYQGGRAVASCDGVGLGECRSYRGAEICGQRFSGGTIVGINAWVIHRDQNVFGEDAEAWNPDRWLGPDEGKRRLMEKTLLTVR